MNYQEIERLTTQYATPMYVFDIGVLRDRIRQLNEMLPENVGLCYAIKANTFILKEIADCLDRFEVCSPGEGYICERLNMPMEKLVISGVYKTPEYIEHLICNHPNVGIYTVESMEQFCLLKELSAKYNVRLSVLLRLTSGNQFGLEEDEIFRIISTERETFDIRGIQYFSGTQKNSVKRLKREIDYLDGFLQTLQQEYHFAAEELEYGPGLPVAYFEAEEFDEAAHLAELSQLLTGMQYQAKVTLELGRSIAASCGTYLSRVVDAKTNKKQNYAILDGGIHHLVYYGQTMAMKIPMHQVFPPREGEEKNWNLCGSLCTINDILVKQLPVTDLKIGDVFAFHNTGAYCMTEGISLFLSRDLPQVVLLKENGETVLARSAVATDPINTPNYERI